MGLVHALAPEKPAFIAAAFDHPPGMLVVVRHLKRQAVACRCDLRYMPLALRSQSVSGRKLIVPDDHACVFPIWAGKRGKHRNHITKSGPHDIEHFKTRLSQRICVQCGHAHAKSLALWVPGFPGEYAEDCFAAVFDCNNITLWMAQNRVKRLLSSVQAPFDEAGEYNVHHIQFGH